MAEVRTFIAIELSEELKNEIEKIQRDLKKELKNLKWVLKTNFHLTLKFLGNTNVRKLPLIADSLNKAVKGMETFSLGFASLGGFPQINYPRVVWLGVDQGRTQVIELQKRVELALTDLGFAPEKQDFSPHLTLARARTDTDLRLTGQRLSQIVTKPTGIDLIKSIHIMKSDLYPSGPVYTSLEQIFF